MVDILFQVRLKLLLMKKVFIFDFDGVFYSGEHKFDNVKNTVENSRRKFLPNINDCQYEQICKDNSWWLTETNGTEVVENIYRLKQKYPQYKISAMDFWRWQNQNVDKLIIDFAHVVDASFMKNLCDKFSVYVVSNSSPNHLKFYMNVLGIKSKWFKKVYSNHFVEYDPTKKHYYEQILKIEDCKPYNACVLGDSIKSDLVPAQELGISTYYVEDANDIPKIVENFLKI